ncbi:MAG: cold-shock protein [Halorhabdus sp.]
MATGTVDFFNDTGGYGFIETEKGPRATNVVRQ